MEHGKRKKDMNINESMNYKLSTMRWIYKQKWGKMENN